MPTTTPRPKPKSSSRATALVLGVFGGFALAVAGALWLSAEPPSAATPESIGGAFSLTAGDGRTVTDRDLRGKYLLVYFGYTHCPDVCPTTLQQVTTALDRLGGKAARLQPVFITVDPARDTPDVMAAYTAAFSPHLLGLTGSAEAIASVEKAFHVYAQVRKDPDGDYSVDHSSVLYLIDPNGRFLAPISAEEQGPAMAADLAKYLS